MIVGTNLVGVVVRGLVGEGVYTESKGEHPAISDIRKKLLMSPRFNFWLTLISVVVASAYIYGLFRIFNLGVALAAVMLMVGRIPDLLHEIKTGKKTTSGNAPKGLVYVFGVILDWGALPLLWFSLR